MEKKFSSTDAAAFKGMSPETAKAILTSVTTTVFLADPAQKVADYSALALTSEEHQAITAQDSAQI